MSLPFLFIMPYQVFAKSICIESEEKPVKLEISEIETKYFLGQIDDTTYNEEWWKWYCQENKLDVTTGKSLRGSSYPRPANYTLF